MTKRTLLIAVVLIAVIAFTSVILLAQKEEEPGNGNGNGNGQDQITICHIPSPGHDQDYCGECRRSKETKDEEGITLTLPRVAAVNGHDVNDSLKGCKGGGPK